MELIVLKVGDVNTTQFVLAEADGEFGSGHGTALHTCALTMVYSEVSVYLELVCDKVLEEEAGVKECEFCEWCRLTVKISSLCQFVLYCHNSCQYLLILIC